MEEAEREEEEMEAVQDAFLAAEGDVVNVEDEDLPAEGGAGIGEPKKKDASMARFSSSDIRDGARPRVERKEVALSKLRPIVLSNSNWRDVRTGRSERIHRAIPESEIVVEISALEVR